MAATLLVLSAVVSHGHAQRAPLRVKTFPGPQNLALFAAQERGLFAKRGIEVEIQFTANSQEQRDGLVAGAFEIAQAGVDNAVVLVEIAKADVVVVAGGSNGMNEFIVRPEITSYDDLRGKKVVVDAPNTAFALLAYKVLALKGIKQGEYGVVSTGGCQQRLAAMREETANAAAMLNLPCNLLALKEGYRSLGSAVDMVGPYQADGIWLLRAWALANGDTLVKFLQASIEGYRWAAAVGNRAEATSIVAKVLKIPLDIAAASIEVAVGREPGLAKDIQLDLPGFRNTLRLRAEMANGDPNAAPEKYLDLSYYERAIAGM